MANEKQKHLITYILLNYGMEPFSYDDWVKAINVVFAGGAITHMDRCNIMLFRENQWLRAGPPYTYCLTDNAIMQLGKNYE